MTNLRLLCGLTAALLFSLPSERLAHAQLAEAARPVIVEYSAPPECASNEAFQVLLKTEIARSPNPVRPWRFSVRIRSQGGVYEGTLTTETGVRQVTASTCDDVTAAFAVIMAMAGPDEPAAPPPPVATLPTPPAAIAPPPPPIASPLPPEPAPPPDEQASQLEWRLGARALASNHGQGTLGGMGVGSVELPWGFRKMMFELGVGEFSAWPAQGENLSASPGSATVSGSPWSISYIVVDTQACLLDLPIASTGLSLLGCLHLAGASFKTSGGDSLPGVTQSGAAFWTGAGARFRWQTPARVFLEVSFDGMYGTVSSGEGNDPGWIAVGASLGVRL